MNIEENKRTTLNILKFLLNFCDEHDLNYFMAYGSALGAVRHHGFIPWDDDIDIYMLREDYDKLLSYRDCFEGTDYKLINLDNTDNYYLKFSKIIDKRTTLWEQKSIPCLIGSFVDIFPLDNSIVGRQSYFKKWNVYNQLFANYLLSISRYSFVDIVKMIKEKHFFQLIKLLPYAFSPLKTRNIKEELQKMEMSFKGSSGDYLLSYTSEFLEMFPKSWFSDYVLMRFEDIDVRMPIGYVEYLTYMYGDYNKLPPIEKRISTHFHYYYNLSESLTLSEVKKRIKNTR